MSENIYLSNSMEESWALLPNIQEACRTLGYLPSNTSSDVNEKFQYTVVIIHDDFLLNDMRFFEGVAQSSDEVTEDKLVVVKVSRAAQGGKNKIVSFMNGTKKRFILYVPDSRSVLKSSDDWVRLLRCIANREKLENYLNGEGQRDDRLYTDFLQFFSIQRSPNILVSLKVLCESALAIALDQGELSVSDESMAKIRAAVENKTNSDSPGEWLKKRFYAIGITPDKIKQEWFSMPGASEKEYEKVTSALESGVTPEIIIMRNALNARLARK